MKLSSIAKHPKLLKKEKNIFGFHITKSLKILSSV